MDANATQSNITVDDSAPAPPSGSSSPPSDRASSSSAVLLDGTYNMFESGRRAATLGAIALVFIRDEKAYIDAGYSSFDEYIDKKLRLTRSKLKSDIHVGQIVWKHFRSHAEAVVAWLTGGSAGPLPHAPSIETLRSVPAAVRRLGGAAKDKVLIDLWTESHDRTGALSTTSERSGHVARRERGARTSSPESDHGTGTGTAEPPANTIGGDMHSVAGVTEPAPQNLGGLIDALERQLMMVPPGEPEMVEAYRRLAAIVARLQRHVPTSPQGMSNPFGARGMVPMPPAAPSPAVRSHVFGPSEARK